MMEKFSSLEAPRLPVRWVVLLSVLLAGVFSINGDLQGQTDYYNTDSMRPVRIEDAYPVERYAFELQVAPIRVERASGGSYAWEFEPELAYGILPRTAVEFGVPLSAEDGGGEGTGLGLGGLKLSLFHNFNVETSTLPALALAGDVLLPVGSAGPEGTYTSVRSVATRTIGGARVHLNGQYTFGAALDSDDRSGEQSRWMAGVAVDRALPLRAALLIADLFVEEPLHPGAELTWTAEGGVRYQLDPFFALDAGVGRRFTGGDQAWIITLGAARAFGLRSLFPGGSHPLGPSR